MWIEIVTVYVYVLVPQRTSVHTWIEEAFVKREKLRGNSKRRAIRVRVWIIMRLQATIVHVDP